MPPRKYATDEQRRRAQNALALERQRRSEWAAQKAYARRTGYEYAKEYHRLRRKRAREGDPPLAPSPLPRQSPPTTPPHASGHRSVAPAPPTPPVMVPPVVVSASSAPSSFSFEKAAAIAVPDRPEDKMVSASVSVEERPCSTSFTTGHDVQHPAATGDRTRDCAVVLAAGKRPPTTVARRGS